MGEQITRGERDTEVETNDEFRVILAALEQRLGSANVPYNRRHVAASISDSTEKAREHT
jgi:hypothetical protein